MYCAASREPNLAISIVQQYIPSEGLSLRGRLTQSWPIGLQFIDSLLTLTALPALSLIRDAHDHFITCLKWAPGLVKPLQPAQSAEKPRRDGDEASYSDTQIRCIVATGSVDSMLRIFAG